MYKVKGGSMNFFQRNANYIVILAVMASSTSGIFSKLITANSMTIGFYRLTFSTTDRKSVV